MKSIYYSLSIIILLNPTISFAQQEAYQQISFTETTTLFFLSVAALSLAPGILIAFTCFPYFVIVFSILRQGLGLQQSPPNMLIISLSGIMTYMVMAPVFNESWQIFITLEKFNIGSFQHLQGVMSPFLTFMSSRVDPSVQNILFSSFQQKDILISEPTIKNLSSLLPSFILSEISRAFEVGFLILLPFLIVDLVAAAVLMSMGMMMVPPAIVSLPFKLAFFVAVDGWALITGSLIRSFI